MKKVFLDTNVLLDFLLDRKPFNDHVAEIFELSISGFIKLCVSSITITDTNYIISRSESQRVANNKIKKLLNLVTVENVGESAITKSAHSKFNDFEDGVQNFCAIEANHTIIITRNTKDFKESTLSILTPKEFLTKIESMH